jgi:type IV secretory pathway VirB10-like protein
VAPATTPDLEAQRRAQEIEAARLSRLFAQTNQQPQPVGLAAPTAMGTTAGPTPTPPVDAGAAQNMQDRKTAFLNASTDKRTVSPDRLDAKASPYVVQAGTVIPAALITGIRSDLPGQITAQVTEAVYDSPTGKYLLIPQGAKLIGQYDSSVAFGQSRVLLVWTRIIMPDGNSIVLERQPGADTLGYAGLEDEVDNHWGMLFKAAVLSTLLSVGAEAGTSQDENNLVQAIRSGASNSISQTGQQIVQRQLNIQPTLTIRPRFPGPRHRNARPGAGALRPGRHAMTKLKLGPLADDKPVKIRIELPAGVHRDLIAYAEILGRTTGRSVPDPAKLIAPMIDRFMATDRAFASARRNPAQSGARASERSG